MRRHKVDILKITGKTQNENGFSIETWGKLTPSPVWADVLDQGSKEFYSAQAEQRTHNIRVNIAYRNDVTDGMRFTFNGKTYQIIRIYQGEYRNIGLEFDGELIEGVED